MVGEEEEVIGESCRITLLWNLVKIVMKVCSKEAQAWERKFLAQKGREKKNRNNNSMLKWKRDRRLPIQRNWSYTYESLLQLTNPQIFRICSAKIVVWNFIENINYLHQHSIATLIIIMTVYGIVETGHTKQTVDFTTVLP